MAENEKIVTTEAKTVETKKADKKKEKKPGFFAKIAKWFRDLKSEAKKVVWPTGKQVVNNTIIVIIAAIVICLFVALLDFVFGAARDLIATIF